MCNVYLLKLPPLRCDAIHYPQLTNPLWIFPIVVTISVNKHCAADWVSTRIRKICAVKMRISSNIS